MGLYRRVPSHPNEFVRHTQHLVNEIQKLNRRITHLEDARSLRPTRWVYVGKYPGTSDPYIGSTQWAKYVTSDRPNWTNGGFPLDPTNSPVRFRLLDPRDITPEIEGGFDGPVGLSLWTMPTGYFRIDVPYVKYSIPAGNSGTITIKITNLGEVIMLA